MAARSVDEINITNWNNTGQTSPFPRYTFDLEIKYTNNEGEQQTHTRQYTFPNDLGTMPLSVRRAFAEKMILATVRVQLGIDEWEQYQ